MTDAEKLLAIQSFLYAEGIRAEDSYKVTLSHKTAQYRNNDQLDYLELIQLEDRWEYFRELDAVLTHIIENSPPGRPVWRHLDRKRH